MIGNNATSAGRIGERPRKFELYWKSRRPERLDAAGACDRTTLDDEAVAVTGANLSPCWQAERVLSHPDDPGSPENSSGVYPGSMPELENCGIF